MALEREPEVWRGTDYRPGQLMRARIYVMAGIFGASGIAMIWLTVRVWQDSLVQGPPLVAGQPIPAPLWWALGAAILLLVPAVLLTIALFLVRWLGDTYLRVAEQGIMYHEPMGTIWTTWDNVIGVGSSRRLFTVIGGLTLRSPSHTTLTNQSRLMSALRPFFLPAPAMMGEYFVPLTILGLDLRRDAPFMKDLRRYAPWLFDEEKQKKR